MSKKNRKIIARFTDSAYTRGNQRRKNARIPMDQTCMFSIEVETHVSQEKGRLTSLSTGGLAMLVRVVLSKGDHLRITFDLQGHMISETGEVTRVLGTEIGVRFINPSETNQSIIQEYIYNRVFSHSSPEPKHR